MAVPDLSLLFDGQGMHVVKPSGDTGRLIPWDALVSLEATGDADLPNGDPGILIGVRTVERSHEFVLPDPEGGVATTLEELSRYCAGGSGTKSRSSRQAFIVALSVVLAAVIVAVVLLLLHV